MTRNQDIGKKSEEYVADYLEKRGCRILARNYSVHNVGEIDIICEFKGKVLVIEVKSRDSRNRYGTPEEAVTKSKQNKIMQTTVLYCKENKIPLERVSYFVAGVTHDASGNVMDVQFTPFFD
ncbi:MAG: YraN family protein [Clostridiales bacterium]|nr:YraN family protein [Clostridiales bacterium]